MKPAGQIFDTFGLKHENASPQPFEIESFFPTHCLPLSLQCSISMKVTQPVALNKASSQLSRRFLFSFLSTFSSSIYFCLSADWNAEQKLFFLSCRGRGDVTDFRSLPGFVEVVCWPQLTPVGDGLHTRPLFSSSSFSSPSGSSPSAACQWLTTAVRAAHPAGGGASLRPHHYRVIKIKYEAVQTKFPLGAELRPQEAGRAWHHSEPYKGGPSAAAATALTLCSLPPGVTLTRSCCDASALVQEAVRLQVNRLAGDSKFRGRRTTARTRNKPR